MMPPTPMPRLTRAKLTPKYCWRVSPVVTAAMSALNAGHETPKLTPRKKNATRTAAGVVAKARIVHPTSWQVVENSSIRRAPTRSVSAPPGPVTASATTAMNAISVPARSSEMPRTSWR